METKNHHLKSIQFAFEFIDQNLSSELSLDRISQVACYSPFHFHRIFKFVTGEPLHAYILRKRIEKAAAILMHQPEKRMVEIAQKLSFNSPSTFTRAFKNFYGLSPTAFRTRNEGKFSKISQIDLSHAQYICLLDNLRDWIRMSAKIKVKQVPGMELAYVTSMGPQGVAAAFDQLIRWAAPKGVLDQPDSKMVVIYHDSFKITAPEKVRISACTTLEVPIEVEGAVGLTKIATAKCIVARFEIGMNEFEKSWTGLFVWMKENGYHKADLNPFEIYHNNFNEHPEKKYIVDFCIPVE